MKRPVARRSNPQVPACAGVAIRELPGDELGIMVADDDGYAAAIALDEQEVAHLVDALRLWLQAIRAGKEFDQALSASKPN